MQLITNPWGQEGRLWLPPPLYRMEKENEPCGFYCNDQLAFSAFFVDKYSLLYEEDRGGERWHVWINYLDPEGDWDTAHIPHQFISHSNERWLIDTLLDLGIYIDEPPSVIVSYLHLQLRNIKYENEKERDGEE